MSFFVNNLGALAGNAIEKYIFAYAFGESWFQDRLGQDAGFHMECLILEYAFGELECTRYLGFVAEIEQQPMTLNDDFFFGLYESFPNIGDVHVFGMQLSNEFVGDVEEDHRRGPDMMMRYIRWYTSLFPNLPHTSQDIYHQFLENAEEIQEVN